MEFNSLRNRLAYWWLVGANLLVLSPSALPQDVLCPNRVASLTKLPGRNDAVLNAQRVEIRQCPLGADEQFGLTPTAGTFQLVAWERNGIKPSLIFNTSESGIYQMAMVEGVYAFELIGGLASQIVVIQFVEGKPRIALNETSRFPFVLEMSKEKLSVTYSDSKGGRQSRSFLRSDSGDRR
jgi:hypothetical protein